MPPSPAAPGAAFPPARAFCALSSGRDDGGRCARALHELQLDPVQEQFNIGG